MNDRRNDVVPEADGTCTWLREHPKYKDWVFKRRGLLCIKGKPGAGKSTLLKYSLQTISTTEPPSGKPLTISFFFHGRGAEIQKTPMGLYRSLLYQLLERFPNALSGVVRTFESRCAGTGSPGKDWDWHVQELRDFFEFSITTILEECAIRVFIDALDECGEGEARRLVGNFERLDSRCSSARHGLAICLSCRHWPVIAPANCLEICAEHENHEDIRTYIRKELQSVAYDPINLQSLQDIIEARSKWVFQWVVLILRRIDGMCRDGKTLRQCLKALQDIPQDWDDLYEGIVQDLKRRNQGESLKLFQWICFARRPLSIAELRCAMNVDPNPAYQSFQECEKLLGYIETDMQMEKQLLSLSGGLAEWKNDGGERVAQLVHQSVSDYLSSKGLYRFDISLDSVDKTVGRSHVRLSRSCIVYFAMDELKKRQHDLEIEYRPRVIQKSWDKDAERTLREEYPLLEYAISSWTRHAQVAEERGIPQNDIFQSLQRHPARTIDLWRGHLRSIRTTRYLPRLETVLQVSSKYNLISLVSAILIDREPYGVDADSMNRGDQASLVLAAKEGHEVVVKLLLAQADIDVNARDDSGRTSVIGSNVWA